MLTKFEDCMLTTYDNPFNPFKDFELWWKEDLRLSHDCCGMLDKFAKTSKVFSDERNHEIVQEAIDEIICRWPMIYRKVRKEDFEAAIDD